MSTHTTENFALHTWEPTDDFLRSEFNDNFQAIDANALRGDAIVVGSYTGDDEQFQDIVLGFRPRLLILAASNGIFQNSGCSGGVFTEANGTMNGFLTLTDTGFRVYYNGGATATNLRSISPFVYLAIR